MSLGRVDGFDQDEAAGEGDQGCVALGRFVASEGDALESFELADRLLDAGAPFVERAWEEARSVLRVVAARDDWADAAVAGGSAVALRVVAFVGDDRARPDVGTDIQQRLELATVARLAAGQMEGEGQAGEIRLDVDLGREPATRAAERLLILPPLAPAAETCARTTVESNICTRCAVALSEARASKNASNTPERLSRQNRFQTLFQLPNSPGSARQVTL